MIGFANPWAALGALVLALPIAVHMLRRHRAPRRMFPTLRFLSNVRVVAVRRHTPTDVPLLMLRLGILAAGVVALAQPVWRGASAPSAPAGKGLARAVVIDRSPRMSQPSNDAKPAADRAQAELARLPAAAEQVVVGATDIRAGLESAGAWAARQAGQRQVVVISSFAQGSLTAGDVAALPENVGLALIPIPIAPEASPAGAPLQRGDGANASLTPVMTLGRGETAVSWKAGSGVTSDAIDWHVSRDDVAGLTAATSAALDVGVVARAGNRPVTIVLPGASDRAAVAAAARAIDAPWMFDATRELAGNATLASAARSTDAVAGEIPAAFTPVVRDAHGAVLLAAASATGPSPALVLLANVRAGTLFTAALGTAVADATRAAPWDRAESQTIDLSDLKRWERPIASSTLPIRGADGYPLGRWLWIAALVGLGAETWWRRRFDPAPAAPVMVNERVA